ncbi:putative Mpv17-like protein 2 [Hypsibius exemplaris]|uniref:Mpv17-like protein 2 n=1 Tax=Hypsibius exemplaris TaxID=2072580 RepID=A0A1W0X5T4_HYPEX|nr:putative Mpv17-like protein 2 [Hypsibius exemplaris]
MSIRRVRDLLFGRHLFLTNTVIGGGLLGLGDLIEQTLEIRVLKSSVKYDWQRAARMTATGFVLGSLGHGWYKVLDKRLPGVDRRTVFKKVTLDLLIAGPITAWVFFWGVGTLEKKRLPEIWSEFLVKFPYLFAFDCCLWPPAQAFNFFYLHPKYRVVYVESLVLFWNIFASYVKHNDLTSTGK